MKTRLPKALAARLDGMRLPSARPMATKHASRPAASR